MKKSNQCEISHSIIATKNTLVHDGRTPSRCLLSQTFREPTISARAAPIRSNFIFDSDNNAVLN